MEVKNNKVKMDVPDKVGAITISGVQLDIEDGITWVPHDMVADAESHGLTVYTGEAKEAAEESEEAPVAKAAATKKARK